MLHRSVPPPPIPDHELLRLIGKGSYGEVWLARNALGTLRAVKIVRRTAFEEDKPFQREFHGIQKFEPISRSHEGLIGILQVGANEAEGYFYYVMELADPVSSSEFRIPGSSTMSGDDQLETRNPEPGTYIPRTLRSDIKAFGPLPPAECVAIGLTLARALAHLHAHKLVHRDIKPSNIIFIGGAPRLADIGLVTDLDATRTYVGTEGFMPPEGPGTLQADLYSMGKVLYEMATGKDRQEFPDLPTALGASAGREQLLELNEIFTKACATDPRRRYQAVEEMQGDLELLLVGKSVKRRHSAARRWGFATKAAVAATVATLVVLGLASLRHLRPQPLDPLTNGKNVGGYPPTAMRGTTNQEAWDHYRLGYFAHRRSTEEGGAQAILHLNQAIALDPKFTLAYAALWRAKFMTPMGTRLLILAESDEWRRLADKLAELDNGLAETHHVLGFIRFCEWKWPEAEAEYREALRLNPKCVPACILLGFELSHVGRTDEALQVLDRGLQLDPNEPQLVKMKGHAYFVRRQFQQALDHYLESIRREPLFAHSHFFAARAYVALTNYPAAIDELQQYDAWSRRAGPPAFGERNQEYEELRRAFQENGARGFWLKRLEFTQARLRPDENPYLFAQAYAWLGDKEQALIFLEKGFERHDELVYLIFDECWDPWRNEPRFEAVRQKVGLPRHPNFPAR